MYPFLTFLFINISQLSKLRFNLIVECLTVVTMYFESQIMLQCDAAVRCIEMSFV